ncbi:MAG: TraR/DksA C4-type zinc finger protein [Candidatus Krumholzibacteria bacterium]|nr:TraR/DksA C4-type zinc finger protein [Candidatus Krumholzibacteria bacterium]
MPAKRKNKLTKKEIGFFKKKIHTERERVLRALGRIEESINEASEGSEGSKQSYSNHMADLGTDYMEKEKNFYYASQEGHYLKSLDEALERMERGKYGNCRECGDLISLKRLEVVPGAKLCISCKSKSEKDQRGR